MWIYCMLFFPGSLCWYISVRFKTFTKLCKRATSVTGFYLGQNSSCRQCKLYLWTLMHACLRMGWFQLQGSLSIRLYFSFRPPTFKEGKIWPESLSERIFRSVNFECANKLSYYTRKNLTTCQQHVFATTFVASLSTSCNNAVILSSCYKVVIHNLLTNCWTAGR